MVETTETHLKDITIQLMIKSLTIPVEEKLPVKIIWTRGAKKAETKKRLLSDTVQTSVFDEKFEVSTQMEIDVSTFKPTKSKMVSHWHTNSQLLLLLLLSNLVASELTYLLILVVTYRRKRQSSWNFGQS